MVSGPDPGCVFCGVVSGRVPAELVWRDEVAVAFLDHRPLFPGHTLVVPCAHVVTLTDLPSADVGPFFSRVRALATAIPLALDATGTFVANNNIVSQSVAHLHVHVVPRRRKDGLRGFFWPRQRYADGEAARVGALIRDAASAIGID